MEFLGVYETRDLGSFKSDGLLGLGRKKRYSSANSNSDKHVIVEQMKRSGVIDESIFSVKLGKLDGSGSSYA